VAVLTAFSLLAHIPLSQGFERQQPSAAIGRADGDSEMFAALQLAEHRAENTTRKLENAEKRIISLEAHTAQLLQAKERLEEMVSQLTADLVEERQCYQQKDMTMKQLIQQKDDIIHTKVSSYFGLVCQSQSGSKSYGCCSHSGHQACGAGAAPSSADPKHLVWGARGTHGVALAQAHGRTGAQAHYSLP
jgi:hypothetical protein